jgi:Arabinose-binding domain of AraC transcription regulator, N-term
MSQECKSGQFEVPCQLSRICGPCLVGVLSVSTRSRVTMATLIWDDQTHPLPEASAETAWRLATTLTGDAVIGVHVAEWLPRGALDLVEYAFRSSASLAAGVERLARYGRVLSDRVAARMETHGEGLLLLVGDTGSTALHPGRAEFALT